MDPVCCLLGICCPPELQREAFINAVAKSLKDKDKEKADKIADALFEEFAAVTKKIKEMTE